MKIYQARTFGMVFVWEDGKRRQLEPRLDLRNHSPTGFSWGYLGSGCAQLALALLVDVLGDKGRVRAVRCLAMELGEPDASGRRRPVPASPFLRGRSAADRAAVRSRR